MSLQNSDDNIKKLFEMIEELREELKFSHELGKNILTELADIKTVMSKNPRKRTVKPKPLPLTQDEIDAHKDKFSKLFKMWSTGDEQNVKEELEGYDVDMLRRFADANNLNVTSKMSKQRVLQLVDTRFREKRMILS